MLQKAVANQRSSRRSATAGERSGVAQSVFGNVAVVLAASELVENGAETNHDASGYLLVKDEGKWRIAAHAWDHASEQRPGSRASSPRLSPFATSPPAGCEAPEMRREFSSSTPSVRKQCLCEGLGRG